MLKLFNVFLMKLLVIIHWNAIVAFPSKYYGSSLLFCQNEKVFTQFQKNVIIW